MTDEKKKQAIVLIGPGRSGTSLAMQVLHGLGMTVSEQIIDANVSNPMGFFEDSIILDEHKAIEKTLGLLTFLPPQPEALNDKSISPHINTLKSVITHSVERAPTIWGFKDPRTSFFIPIWTKIFNATRIIPKYILCLRSPASVVVSLRQHNVPDQLSELLWLTRTAESLYFTGGDCFVLHYEDWFMGDALSLMSDLARYTGLDEFRTEEDIEQLAKSTIKKNLNRSSFGSPSITNPLLSDLYGACLKARGADFDREALMKAVIACREGYAPFLPWAAVAHEKSALQARTSAKDVDLLKKELEKVVLENSNYLLQIKDLSDQLDYLKRRGTSQCATSTLQWRKEALGIKHSSSYRLGSIFVNAVAKPGKNTLLAPFAFMALCWDAITGRGRNKAQAALKTPHKGSAKYWKQEVENLKNSRSLHLGQAFILAVKRPGKNTIALPYRAIKLLRGR